jgi:hypothetical protein
MSNTTKIQASLSQQTMRNRIYNRQMRNLYYEKSAYLFRKIQKNMDCETSLSELEQLPELYEFLELLNICLSYANASIYCSKSEKTVSYSQDHHWGIMQEEIVLVYFLEEQISSVKYVISHIETNRRIQVFANKNETDILLNHMLANIAELNQDTEKDLCYFYDNIEKRYKIGNKLFGILQEKQNLQGG